MYRIIDANINRICEGLRVIEDFMRFSMNSGEFIKLKEIRHYLREKISKNIKKKLLINRNSIEDKGQKLDKIEINRNNIQDIIKANLLRVEEGLRVLEEAFKLYKELYIHVKIIKSYRFIIYNLEKKIILSLEKNQINITNYLSIDIDNISITNYKKTIKQILKNNNIKSLEFSYAEANINKVYEILNFTKNLTGININIFIKNSLELAILLDLDGIIIDDNYLPITIIKKHYDKTIGITINHLDKNNYKNFNDFDFILIDNLNDKLIKNYLIKNKCNYAVKNNKAIKLKGLNLDYNFYCK